MQDYEQQARTLWQPWYQQEYQTLIEAIKQAVTRHIEIFKQQFPGKEVYGYSLYSCNGLPHITPVLQSIEANAAAQLENPEDQAYCQYSPDEWQEGSHFDCFTTVNSVIDEYHQLFDACDEAFNNIYQSQLSAPINQEAEDYWQRNVTQLFNVMVQAMSELNEAGAFDWLVPSQKLLLVWFSDASAEEFSLVQSSVERLNSPEQTFAFIAALGDEC